MLSAIGSQLADMTSDMSRAEWLIALAVLILLIVSVVRQLTKVALLAVILVAVGVFLLHGRSEHWFTF